MQFFLNSREFIETNEPLDISLSLTNLPDNVRAWYVEAPEFKVVRANGFVGSVAEGGSTNFRDVFFNPHGHGTHTECCGHITPEVFSINQRLKTYFFRAKLISVEPEITANGDRVVFARQLESKLADFEGEALVIRTLPNGEGKLHKNYSATNPPYLDLSLIPLIEAHGIQHLLVDTPSVDRESDGGKLAFHHAFWNVPENPNFKTITELVFVKSSIADGEYILEMQFAPFENDASPSRPVLYAIQQKK